MPAQKDALALSPMSKSLTITQAYGKHDASAIGSATRHIAVGNHQWRVVDGGVGGMGMGIALAYLIGGVVRWGSCPGWVWLLSHVSIAFPPEDI